jgi:heme-degrading monooxygenase HmoA
MKKVGTIIVGQSIVTLINVFTVEPENQQAIVDSLIQVTQELTRTLPGYISANVHKSIDGKRIVNYVQWRSQADFEAMLHHPVMQAHMKEVSQLAIQVDPHFYEVAFVNDAV